MLAKLVNPPLASTNGFNFDNEVSGPGLEVAIVKTTQEERYWVLDGVYYSYDDKDALGNLIVMDGDKVVIDLFLPVPMGHLDFYLPASPGRDLKILLGPGNKNKDAPAITGKLCTMCHLENPV